MGTDSGAPSEEQNEPQPVETGSTPEAAAPALSGTDTAPQATGTMSAPADASGNAPEAPALETFGKRPEPEPVTPSPVTSSASPEPAPATPSPATPPAVKDPRAQLTRQIDFLTKNAPDSPEHYVLLARYFRTAPRVVARFPDEFKLAYANERYQDWLLNSPTEGNPFHTLDEMAANAARSGAGAAPATQPSTPPTEGKAHDPADGFSGKARNADEAQFFKSFGLGLLAKHFGVPPETVGAMPELYWKRYAKEAEDMPPDGPLLPAAPDPLTSKGEDPLSRDPGLKKLILQNPELFTNEPAGQGNSGAAYPNFGDSIPHGKGRTSVFVFDAGRRPPDKGVHGTTYGGVGYTVSTGATGGITVRGPYRFSTYSNSISNADNSPKWAEVKGKTLSEGGEDYTNMFGHLRGTPDFQQGLNMGHYEQDKKGRMEFFQIVETTGPNSVNNDQHIMVGGNVHSGKSDNGGSMSRGSRGCFTIHPDDAPSFLNHNFEWNTASPNTGTSRGFVYTYRGDSPEASAIRNWLESQNPTK